MTGRTAPDAGPPTSRLVVPAGWVVDRITLARLRWQLEAAPSHVRGVVTTAGPLRAGTSHRTHAERLSLLPREAVAESVLAETPGAALVRADTVAEATPAGVTIDLDGGTIIVDHGTHAHDPSAPNPALRDASSWGRPPFSSRPVVVLLAVDDDQEAAARAALMVDELIELGVEARLAVPTVRTAPEVPSGPRLSRPCAASAASIAALRPDVVVALDDAASLAAAEWAPGRWTRRFRVTDGDGVDLALRTARGEADGAVGRGATASDVAAAVHRVCARVPPLVADPTPVARLDTLEPTRRRGRRRPETRRSVAVVAGVLDESGGRRVRGLVGALRGVGQRARLLTTVDDSVLDDDVLVVHGARVGDRELEVVARRRAAGRVSLLDLGAADVVVDGDREGELRVELTAEAIAAVATTGHLVVPSERLAAVPLGPDVRRLWLPTVWEGADRPTPGLTARPDTTVGPGPSIGWDCGSPEALPAAELDDVAEHLLALLERHDDLALEIVGDPAKVPDRVLEHPRAVVTGLVSERWTAQLWSPHPTTSSVMGDVWPVVHAGRLGVPTITTRASRDAAARQPWADEVGDLLTDPVAAAYRRSEAAALVDAEHGPASAQRAAGLLVDWARRGQAVPSGRTATG